jgi:AcrR family transcriptional regulator
MAVRKRDHLVSVAQRLFCARGFHAVSIDDILAEAGVARMTLYKNFDSKEELIVATLRLEDKTFRQWLASFVEAWSLRPVDRIASLFAGLHERFSAEGYYGCAFIRASVEFPDITHPVHRVATEHKEMMRCYFRGLAAQANVRNPSQLAEQIYLLFEGAIVASQLHGDPWPADCAGKAAELLLTIASKSAAATGKQLPAAVAKRSARGKSSTVE